MKTNLKIFLMLLYMSLCTFQAFSSTILEDESSQILTKIPGFSNDDTLASTAQMVARRSVLPQNNLRAFLGGALVLASQISGTMAGECEITFDDSICSWNSTSRHISCVCPATAGTSPGEFYVNNIGVILTTTVSAILIAPKINEKIITPALDYISNRFFKTTIDDVPLLSYKLRDYEAAGLPKKFVAEFKLIDEILTTKKWAKEKLISNKKFFGFSYGNAALNIQIKNSSLQGLLEEQLIDIESQERSTVWKQFADLLNEGNKVAVFKALPEKVYHAIGRLCLNNDQDPASIRVQKGHNNLVFIITLDKGISIRITKH